MAGIVNSLKLRSSRLVPVVLILVCIVLAVGAGWATTRLKSSMTAITAIVGISSVVVVLVSPMLGIVSIMLLLFFPILPQLSLGPMSISVTTLPVIGLSFIAAMRVFVEQRSSNLKVWQIILLAVLIFAFLLPVLTSESMSKSLMLLPNLIIYVLILFSIMVLVKTPEQLVLLAKMILVLVVMMVAWKYLLRPVRGLFSLSGLGVNGLVFMFHPGFAVALTCILTPLPGFSQRWRWFAWFCAGLIVVFSIYLQSRAGWIALLVMLGLAILVMHPRKIGYVLGSLLLVIMLAWFYKGIVQTNVSQTVETVVSLVEQPQGSIEEGMISPDDLIRVVARDAAQRMIEQRPWTGWGPGMFPLLKPAFAEGPSKYSVGPNGEVAGAFNAWLMLLAEMGIPITLVVAIIFLLPLFIIARALFTKSDRPIKALAFAFALGVVGLSIHLLFIDLLYGSFVWLQLGLALAALRVVNE
jgi:O-antigen ligase